MIRTPEQPFLLWIYSGAVLIMAAWKLVALALLRHYLNPLIIAVAAVSLAFAGALGYALLNDKYWARALLAVGAVLTAFSAFARLIATGHLLLADVVDVAVAGFTFWYLYAKPNVVEYFDHLHAEADAIRQSRGA